MFSLRNLTWHKRLFAWVKKHPILFTVIAVIALPFALMLVVPLLFVAALALPVYGMYYLWRKSKFSKVNKVRISAAVAVLFLIWAGNAVFANVNSNRSIAEARELLRANDMNGDMLALEKSSFHKNVKFKEKLEQVGAQGYIRNAAISLSFEEIESGIVETKFDEDEALNAYIAMQVEGYVKDNKSEVIALKNQRIAREKLLAEQEVARQKQAEEQAKIDARRALIAKQFDPWDGNHIYLEQIVKASMHNPDSYKHVDTGYTDKGTYLLVTTTFRGTNAFGGVITNSVTAKTDVNTGMVLEIIE